MGLGLYKQETEKMQHCLDEETAQNLEKIVSVAMNPSTAQEHMFEIMGAAPEVFKDLNNCKFQGPALDLMAYCAHSGSCGVGSITKSLQKNMFILMGKITGFMELMPNMAIILTKEPAEAKSIMRELG